MPYQSGLARLRENRTTIGPVLMMLKIFLQDLMASFQPVSVLEKILSGVASFIAILLVYHVSQRWLGADGAPLIIASMGASAVLLFAVPQGPLSQPWNCVGGHVLSAVIGVACAQWVDAPLLAAALAVALSVTTMYLLQCLHPPGGATALNAVIGGQTTVSLGYGYVLFPVLLNISMMLFLALIVNNVLPNRRYPNFFWARALNKQGEPEDEQNIKMHLRSALKEVNTFIDASEEDLSRVFNAILTHERRAQMGEILCQDIMHTEMITAFYETEIEDIWRQMVSHHFPAIPIIDAQRRLLGMLRLSDFLQEATQQATPHTIFQRITHFSKRTEGQYTNKIEYAGHLMHRPVLSVQQDQHILDLFPLMEQHHVRYIPVLDAEQKLVGLISQKRLLAALYADFMQYQK